MARFSRTSPAGAARSPRTSVLGLPLALALSLAPLMLFLTLAASAFAADAPRAEAPKSGGTILTGKVMTTVIRAIPMPFNSVVDTVLVKPGDAVEEGAPLMRYHLHEDAERAVQREVMQGASTEGLKSQVLDLERRLAETIAQRNKARQLAASGLGSRQASGRLEEDVTSLQKRIELTRITINKAENSFAVRLKELSSYYGQEIKEGEILPDTLTLTSPLKGYVLSLDATLNSGTLLSAGSAPIKVGQLNPVLIQVPVYEAEVSGISEGDKVAVEIPSLGNKAFTGKVTEISWVSSDMNVANPSYYTVEITVPNPDLELKPGFKAVVRFGGSR